jgi:hypothetical protein
MSNSLSTPTLPLFQYVTPLLFRPLGNELRPIAGPN